MFTGIIQQMGTVEELRLEPGGARLVIQVEKDFGGMERGESIAVNGVCLTALPSAEHRFAADLSLETLSRTTLGTLESGTRVNLERSLALGDRLGGHLVQGHVDAVGSLSSIREEGSFAVYRWSFPESYADLVVEKGSIAVDGVSLTIIGVEPGSFGVALIPETLSRTTLGTARPGDRFNLELDIMAKYARSLFLRYLPGAKNE